MAYDDSIKTAYGEWLALPQADRATKGEPTSIAAWGREFNVSAKTLYRWKDEPDDVVQAAKNRAEARASLVTPAEANADPERPDDTGAALHVLKNDMLDKALKGDKKSIDLFMRYFGKQALEEERRARQSGLKSLTDDELADAILTALGPETVQAWLDSQ